MTGQATARTLPRTFFTFLRELARNNSKTWFDAHRDRYEAQVQEPVRALVRYLMLTVPQDFPELVGSDAKAGGSMTRLHRDVRFSKDKQPFHTHVGLHFWHRDGKKMELPGLFLRLSPDGVMLGTGLHQPAPPLLAKVRDAIDDDQAGWHKASRNTAFIKAWHGLDGESLKRVPAPWPPDHPYADDLRRKDFTAFIHLPAAAATAPGFADKVLGQWKCSQPLMAFLTEAVRS